MILLLFPFPFSRLILNFFESELLAGLLEREPLWSFLPCPHDLLQRVHRLGSFCSPLKRSHFWLGEVDEREVVLALTGVVFLRVIVADLSGDLISGGDAGVSNREGEDRLDRHIVLALQRRCEDFLGCCCACSFEEAKGVIDRPREVHECRRYELSVKLKVLQMVPASIVITLIENAPHHLLLQALLFDKPHLLESYLPKEALLSLA